MSHITGVVVLMNYNYTGVTAVPIVKFLESLGVLRKQHPAFLCGAIKMLLISRVSLNTYLGRGSYLMSSVLQVLDEHLVIGAVVKVYREAQAGTLVLAAIDVPQPHL